MPEGFLASLFDVEFKSLITTKVIKVLYILSMIVIGLAALALVAAAFANSVAGGLIVLLIVAPLVAVIYLIYVRVLLEIVLAVFRIMETNKRRGNVNGGWVRVGFERRSSHECQLDGHYVGSS